MQMGNHRALICERNDFHLITKVLLPPKLTWVTEAKAEKPSVGTERTVWIQNGCRPLLCEVRSPNKFVFRVARWDHFWAFLLLKTSKPEVYWRRSWSWTLDPVNQTVKQFSIQHIFLSVIFCWITFGTIRCSFTALILFPPPCSVRSRWNLVSGSTTALQVCAWSTTMFR